ncbi:MAG: SMP-30/gluconolactonase/LRE family protein [Burkholderiaceae bacterium]|nr:MAG: SMP-30/gluconolactonase/LRE family protein [Burkholderiaceae bacterium]
MRILGLWSLMTAVAFCPAGARADEMSDIVAPGAKIEKIAHGFRFTEGPVWSPKGTLLFSDIPADTIYEWVPGPGARRSGTRLPASLVGSLRVFRWPSGKSNGLTLDKQGRLVACEHDRRVSRRNADGTLEALAERFSGKRLNSPNDLVVKSDGSIYFTDPPYGIWNAKDRELDFSGVYRIAPNGQFSALERNMPFPNGLAFSPDETRLYVVDSGANQIRVFDVKPDGSLGDSRLFAEINLAGSREGPDGIKVDDRGNVYSAGPDGVWVLAPDGRLIGKILTPEVPSNLAFGGDARSTLYITARTGVYRISLKTSSHARWAPDL